MNHYEAKQEARRQRLEDRAERLQQEANGTYNRARDMAAVIPFGQPILVGHHSEKRDRNYRDKIHNTYGKAFALEKEAGEAAARAAGVGTAGVSSDDPEAVQKLQEQLAGLEELQAKMVAANKLVRKGDVAGLAELMGSQVVAEKLMQPDCCGRKGFPDYATANNNANMRRIKQRIEHLKRKPTETVVTVDRQDGVRIVENAELNRLQIFFPDKPNAAVRAELKGAGFRWAPSEGAWQRHLGNSARWQAERIIEKL